MSSRIVDTVKVSSKGKDILLRLKKRTGLQHWNELCRVALCRSLAEPTSPIVAKSSSDVAIEMDWKTFAGAHHEVLSTILIIRANKDGVDRSEQPDYLRAHLERGLASLSRIKTLPELVSVCLGERRMTKPEITQLKLDEQDRNELPV